MIEFSYASYVKELNKEEIMNNTDDSLFSSLADLTGNVVLVVVVVVVVVGV